MDYILFTAGGQEYKLRLSTRNIVALEKALGTNPIQMFMDLDNGTLPKLTDLIIILQACLTSYQHGMTVDKTYDVFDAFVADGHNMFDLVPIIIEVFTACGFVSSTPNEAEAKNA